MKRAPQARSLTVGDRIDPDTQCHTCRNHLAAARDARRLCLVQQWL